MKTYQNILSFVLLFFVISCAKEETKPTTNSNNGNNNNGTTATAPAFDASVVSTTEGITDVSFKISSTLKANGGSAITQHGHVWSDTKTEPTIADSKTELGATTGPFPLKFTSEIKNLKANTTYNVRAYATNDKGTTYGAVVQTKTASQPIKVSFTTQDQDILVLTGSEISVRTFLFANEGAKIEQNGHAISSTNKIPTINDLITKLGSTTVGSSFVTMKSDFTKLSGKTTYYIRPYATIGLETYYGPVTTLITKEQIINSATVTKKADFPGKISDELAFSLNENVYVPTNSYYNSTTKSDATDFYEFNPKSNTWRIKATFNIGEFRRLGYGLSFTHKGKFYAGLTNNYPTKIIEFDLETQKYITKYDYNGKKPFGFSAYSKMNATYIDGKVYMLVYEGVNENKFVVFDIEKNTYTELQPLPNIGSIDPLITSVNGKVYAMLRDGFTNSKNGRLYMFDPSTKTWAEKASGHTFQKFSTYRFNSLTSIGAKIYALNAWGAAEYNTETNTWRKVLENKDLIDDLDSQALGRVDGNIYLGLKNGSKKNWYEFKP